MQKPSAAGFSVDKNPDKSAHMRREPNYVQILSLNTRGFNDEKEEMVLAMMQQKNVFAYTFQETWKLGDGLYEKNLLLMNANEKPVSVVLVSAYAPIGAAKEAIRHDFATALELCMEAPKSNKVLLICVDANASMSLHTHGPSHGRDQVLGPFGVNHVNDAGRELHDLLCANLAAKGMCSAAIFFQIPAYASSHHPRSKKGHQLDHFLIPSRDLFHVSDAGISKLTVESDHDPLYIKLSIARNLSKQHESKASFVNQSLLRDPIVASNFRHAVLKHLGNDLLRPEFLTHSEVSCVERCCAYFFKRSPFCF